MSENRGKKVSGFREITPLIPHPELPKYHFSMIEEQTDGYRHWLYFKMNEVTYQMIITGHLNNPSFEPNELIAIVHLENTCPFCGEGATKGFHCIVLNNHAFSLFCELIPYSKNRLRWLMEKTTSTQ